MSIPDHTLQDMAFELLLSNIHVSGTFLEFILQIHFFMGNTDNTMACV